jgi:hypothetical protein
LILLISASWVARITGMNQCLAYFKHFCDRFNNLFYFIYVREWGLNLGFKLAKQVLYCLSQTYIFFFFQNWGLNSGPTPWATPPAFLCEGFFFETGSRELFASAGFKPPDLCLLCS